MSEGPDRFEAWLTEHDITIAGQYSTGSGDMVRYRLRLTDGFEFDVAIQGEALIERPDDAIEQVRSAIERRRGGSGRTNGAR